MALCFAFGFGFFPFAFLASLPTELNERAARRWKVASSKKETSWSTGAAVKTKPNHPSAVLLLLLVVVGNNISELFPSKKLLRLG